MRQTGIMDTAGPRENDEEEKVEKGELQFSWKPTEKIKSLRCFNGGSVEKGGRSGSWNGPGDPRFQCLVKS